MLNFSEFSKTVLFNGEVHTFKAGIEGASIALLFADRGVNARGNSNPPYYDHIPERSGYGSPLFENKFAKGKIFHGLENTLNTYSETGERYDIKANPNWTPVDSPFFEMVGDVKDPLNERLTRHKYVSNVKFLIGTVANQSFNDKAIDMRGTSPVAPKAQFISIFDWLSAPPNWKERSYYFYANNTFNGYKQNPRAQRIYNYNFNSPHRYIYPSSPGQEPREFNDLGGNIIDGDGEKITLPEWFKI